MIDSHCHLHLKDYDEDRDAIFERLRDAGVTAVLEVGINFQGSVRALELAARYPEMLVAVGCHPHDSEAWDDDFATSMKQWAADPRVRAFGELGLDYYRNYAPHDVQQRVFRDQLALARECSMPVVFHVRAAEEDFLRIVDEVGPPERAVLHAFSHSAQFAAECIRRGFRLGIGGMLTFPRSDLPVILADISPEVVLLETDCPWLAPVPRRGRRNEPALLIHVLQKLSEIWNLPPSQLEERLDANFTAFAGAP